MKQGKECSFLLEYRNGKVTTTLKISKLRLSEARTPTSDTKYQAEKIKKGYGGKIWKLYDGRNIGLYLHRQMLDWWMELDLD